jgi:Eco57I restriction-modification methylase/restriction endonuclease TaqI-like protein
MAHTFQTSLLSRGPLFERGVLDQYCAELRSEGIPEEASRARKLREWLVDLDASKGTKETALEQGFNQRVLGEILGYGLWPRSGASAWPKAPTTVTAIGGEPDVLLGRFEEGEEPAFLAVLELKGPRVDLDKPQARASGRTAVEQAFDYGRGILGVTWVLVSDMRRIRLYSVESPHEAVSFDLDRCCTASGEPTPAFRELWGLLSRERLIDGGPDSAVARLLTKSISRQLEVRESFYDAYYLIRADLLESLEKAAEGLSPTPTRDEILTATQRLLDRLIFIFYCEDAPARLLPPDTVKTVTDSARRLPGPSASKVYTSLKALFEEVDKGSPPGSLNPLPAYNGELFKHDPIIDAIDLPDSLHDKVYTVSDGDRVRKIHGAWGLHAFDFWRELNAHLLGHIFEQSLSDLSSLAAGGTLPADRLAERKRHGIYYTSELLSDALCEGSVRAILDEVAPTAGTRTQAELKSKLDARKEHLRKLRIVDLACGSGAFLVSSYQSLLEELWRIEEAADAIVGGRDDLLSQSARLTHAELLREALHGVDLLPQAAEIAKLALWLRSAHKGERVPDLSRNIVAADSLDVDRVLALLETSLESFDLVVGNPPWGADLDRQQKDRVVERLGLDNTQDWDSFELFTALGMAFLKPGGRLALVLPDTFFSPEKAKTRELVLAGGTVERINDLGPDWFDDVRMGTVLLQLRRGEPDRGSTFRSVLLSGDLRRKAIAGKVPLSQIETKLGRSIPQDRAMNRSDFEIEVFRSVRDDEIMGRMLEASLPLAQLCDRGRGEEMSKSGLLWVCPSCLTSTVPATKRKADPRNPDGPKYQEKDCPSCGLALSETNVSEQFLVGPETPTEENGRIGYVDGDDLTHRWQTVEPRKSIDLGLKGFPYKDSRLYADPKILVRKTGVGIMAAYDTGGARFPQTVFFYRLKAAAKDQGYREPFVLAALLSRTMAYYLFKRYGQIDPARGHAHVTHKRLEALPIPAVDFDDPGQRARHDEIVELGERLLASDAEIGGPEDIRIELLLRELWGVSGEDGQHINFELAQVPESQTLRELFPKGLPKQILSSANADAKALISEVPGTAADAPEPSTSRT